MKDNAARIKPAGTTLLTADHEVELEFPGDYQLFFLVIRESHGELELLTISGAHSSTEENPEGVDFTIDMQMVELDSGLLSSQLAEMDEETADRVRYTLGMSLDDLMRGTMLLSYMDEEV